MMASVAGKVTKALKARHPGERCVCEVESSGGGEQIVLWNPVSRFRLGA